MMARNSLQRSLAPASREALIDAAAARPTIPGTFSVPDRNPPSFAVVQSAAALWAVKLVGRDRGQVDAELPGAERHFAEGLHAVGMDERLGRRLPDRSDDLGERLDGARLVVHRHDRDEDGIP